jgi:uncharacterized RDD family membrane protein YckC
MRNINPPIPRARWRLLRAFVLATAVAGAAAPSLAAQDAPAAPEVPVAPVAAAAPPAAQPPVAPPAPRAAQAPSAPEAADVPEVPDAPEAPFGDEMDRMTWSRPAVRVGQNYELRAGDRAREVVVVFGSATIGGEVDRDVVVVFGSVRLLPTARIHGSLVTTGGGVTIEDGATVGRDFVVTAGGVDAPPAFHPGGDYVIVGLPGMARQGEAVVPFFTRGLLWGRLIVPSLPWLWAVVAVIVLVYLAINLLFDRPVRACVQVLESRPLSAFLVGLLALILIGPVSFILAVSVIGIPVVPFLVCGLFIAGLLGKVGVTRWLGSSLVAETEPGSRAQSVRSFFIGTAVILLAYMVPVLGILTWAVGGVFGLGAATLAFSSGLRRENPARKRVASAATTTAATVAGAPSLSSLGQPLQASAAEAPVAAGLDGPSVPLVEPAPAAPQPPGAGAATFTGAGLLGMPKAPFLDRLAAFALDVLLVSLTYSLLDLNGARVFFTLLLAYHIVFWGLKATTVGGIICNLRVIRVDGLPLTFTDALIRGFSSIFSLAAFGIGCVWILFDDESQAWHDRFAGTYVVKVPRNWPV